MNATVPVHNSRALAAYLAEHDMPGRRSMTAIDNLRRARAKNRPAPVPATRPTPADRLRVRLTRQAVAEIARRGGETYIEGEKGRVADTLSITERDKATGTMLLRASGWRYYSRAFGSRHVELAYVYGTDDAGPWAVRVPGTITSLAKALEWMEPAEVTKARTSGRRVRRQGDIYAIETTRAHDGKGSENLPDAHEWRPGTRYLVHRPEDGRRHRPLKLTVPVRFVRQRVLEMGRSGHRAYGD
ncbi:hypothetical protein ACWCXX_24905 [Streptomyces sp. NPDC001732]